MRMLKPYQMQAASIAWLLHETLRLDDLTIDTSALAYLRRMRPKPSKQPSKRTPSPSRRQSPPNQRTAGALNAASPDKRASSPAQRAPNFLQQSRTPTLTCASTLGYICTRPVWNTGSGNNPYCYEHHVYYTQPGNQSGSSQAGPSNWF